MRITNLMSEALVLPEIKAVSRDEALRELVGHLAAHAPFAIDPELTYTRLLDRERLASTAVGHGIAIPHAKLPGIDAALACLGRSRVGLEFGSKDGAPTHILLAILAPEGNAGLHLKALARASRLLMDEAFRAAVTEIDDPAELWRAIEAHDDRLSS